MALELKLSQKLSQSLVMTPQLRQAIRLLQLGRMELVEVLEKELLENPMLEDAREDDFNQDNDEKPAESSAELNDRSAFEVAQDWSRAGGGNRGSLGSIESNISNPEGLSSHLMWQLRTEGLTLGEQRIAELIVGNLDRDGYLRCTIEDLQGQLLAVGISCELEEIEEVLERIQTLDPAGIGARSISECLCIQLEQLGLGDGLAYRICRRHLELLESGKFAEIAKIESVEMNAISAAVTEIRKLDPQPGRAFNPEQPVYIVPDVYIRKVGDKLEISLNDYGLPRLRLSSVYRKILDSGIGESSKYFQDRFKSASWLIKSIEQRQKTIFKVTESIFKHQKEFLEKGVSTLKPLVLKDIACDIGLHESTVSRVTTNKYVHTPQGVYELKYFFSSCLQGELGKISSESVKDKIKSLIDQENPKRPLSDQALVKKLKAEGVDVARRTVAKYREVLKIPSSTKRKKRI